jgi:hypothetical protein
LVALRRPLPEPQPLVDNRIPESHPGVRAKRVPRWIVVSGLVAYCSVFWLLIWAVGTFGIDLVRSATAGAP